MPQGDAEQVGGQAHSEVRDDLASPPAFAAARTPACTSGTSSVRRRPCGPAPALGALPDLVDHHVIAL
ncbi:hypothetical protein [Streptomyces sp. NRRL B-3648]|uniref:hypothetical protein n=1 Tax=Streptomyces sp. NRRL B-3648 TaxID=1519493 RepID=UPI00131E310E|nr:hypothetical protein [Streptomyces sp. NRRL B-3648]